MTFVVEDVLKKLTVEQKVALLTGKIKHVFISNQELIL